MISIERLVFFYIFATLPEGFWVLIQSWFLPGWSDDSQATSESGHLWRSKTQFFLVHQTHKVLTCPHHFQLAISIQTFQSIIPAGQDDPRIPNCLKSGVTLGANIPKNPNEHCKSMVNAEFLDVGLGYIWESWSITDILGCGLNFNDDFLGELGQKFSSNGQHILQMTGKVRF